ncbi:MAG: Stp1/IreP family PP2C-type Ser/Thr phosphatase [Lachnospiraceae bacterium]
MKASALTDVGRTRKINQDSVYASTVAVGKLKNLFIIADGMGGHKAGDTASRCAVETVVDTVKNSRSSSILGVLDEAIRNANDKVLEVAATSEDFSGMGTTLVVATIEQGMLCVGNVGDSRLYLVGDEIRQITRDHSLVEEMVSIGELERSQARTHTNKNIITRAIGADKKVMADFFEVQINPNDKFVMCSDGLSNMVEDDTIRQVIKNFPCDEAAGMLVDLANQNGGKDNISVIIIEP